MCLNRTADTLSRGGLELYLLKKGKHSWHKSFETISTSSGFKSFIF